MSGQEILDIISTCKEAIDQYGLGEIGTDGCSACDKVKFCLSNGTLHNVDLNYLLPHNTDYNFLLPEIPILIDAYPGNTIRDRIFVSVIGDYIALKYSAIGVRSRNGKPSSWREQHGVGPDTTLLLYEESTDDLIESVARAAENAEFFERIQSLGKIIAVPPGFSVYTDGYMCKFAKKQNISRTFRFLDALCAFGIPALPFLAWHTQSDINALVHWVNQHKNVTHVAINTQLDKNHYQLVKQMEMIENQSRKLHWIVFGGPTAAQYLIDHGFKERIHLVSTYLQKVRTSDAADDAALLKKASEQRQKVLQRLLMP